MIIHNITIQIIKYEQLNLSIISKFDAYETRVFRPVSR